MNDDHDNAADDRAMLRRYAGEPITRREARRFVRQSAAIHPDWTSYDHLSYLRDNEGYNLITLGADPEGTIGQWLDEFREVNKLIQHLVRDHGWMQPVNPSDISSIIAQHAVAKVSEPLPGCDQFPSR